MNAIPMYEFQKLSSAMSRCKITAPQGNISYILDRENEKVGEINWLEISITIYESYEYADEVLERLGKFTEVKRDYDISEEPPVTFEDGEPSLTEYGKKLYDKPNNIDESTINQIIQ